jgi:hypothetical protein
MFPPVYLRAEIDPVSEKLCSVRNTKRWTKYRKPVTQIEITRLEDMFGERSILTDRFRGVMTKYLKYAALA